MGNVPSPSERYSRGLRALSLRGTLSSLWVERGCASLSYLQRRRGYQPRVGPSTSALMAGRWPCIHLRTLWQCPSILGPFRMYLFTGSLILCVRCRPRKFPQECSNSYPKNGYRATTPSRLRPSPTTRHSKQLHRDLSSVHVHQPEYRGNPIPRVRTSRTGDRRRQVVCMELENTFPGPCEFSPYPDVPFPFRVTYTFVPRTLELEQYLLRNPYPLQRYLAAGRVRLPTHRRSPPRQLRSPSYGHIHHPGPKDQIRTLRPIIRRSRPLCRVTFG